MTRLLSFDVGVTNLAFCLVEFTENEHKIIDWGVIDVMESFEDRKIKCSVVKNGVICNSDAVTYVEVDDKQLGFCNKKNCQSIVNSVYSKKQIKKTKKVNERIITKIMVLMFYIESADFLLIFINFFRFSIYFHIFS